ncbi:MAG: MFS transporter [Bacteroidetes bacterium]|nr:MAG: MFS transporter [Bacteroidota bacterium]
MKIKNNKKIIEGWVFYDWANSVFPLVITSAIFPNFYEYVTSHHPETKEFTGTVIEFLGHTFQNTTIYSMVYSAALMMVVLIVPMLSGIADYLGNKKKFLQFFCYIGAISSMLLYFFNPQYIEMSMLPFMTATIGYWGSLVYYNSYLPEIVDEVHQDKISAKGFAYGYFGSSLLLIVCLILIMSFKVPVKYIFLLVGLWWMGFAQFTFMRLPRVIGGRSHSLKNILWKGYKELSQTFRQALRSESIKKFLTAYFFYNMGVQTVMVMAVLFARQEIHWPSEEYKTTALIISILIIQFLGIAGSYFFSFLSKLLGNVYALIIAVGIWIFICLYTYLAVFYPEQFYVVAALVGFVMGGTQSLSRSTYSKLLPETIDHASYFSFFDVLEKIGMILGTLSFGLVGEYSGGLRKSVPVLSSFFIIGIILLFLLLPYNKFLKHKK